MELRAEFQQGESADSTVQNGLRCGSSVPPVFAVPARSSDRAGHTGAAPPAEPKKGATVPDEASAPALDTNKNTTAKFTALAGPGGDSASSGDAAPGRSAVVLDSRCSASLGLVGLAIPGFPASERGAAGRNGSPIPAEIRTFAASAPLARAAPAEAGKPEAGKAEAGKPEAGKPEAGKAEAGKPEAGKAEAGKPEAGKPEAGKPEAGKAEAGKAEAGKPEAGKAEAAAPGAQSAPAVPEERPPAEAARLLRGRPPQHAETAPAQPDRGFAGRARGGGRRGKSKPALPRAKPAPLPPRHDTEGEVFALPPPSPEQREAIRSFASSNLIVNSVAGSGKTTLILHLVRTYPEWNFLVLTYNRKLMDETKTKAAALGLPNVEVRTYHSFAQRYLGKGRNDAELDSALSSRLPALGFDVLVVDEVQDMKDLFFRLVGAIWDACSRSPCLVFLGDENQCVYAFAGADPRFLTAAHLLLPFEPFSRVFLTTSYRLTAETAEFVNGLVGERRIRSDRHGPKPLYLIDNPFCCRATEALVREYVSEYSPGEVFVLAPTVRKSACCKRLVDRLSGESPQGHVNVYVPDDDEQPSEKDMEGKLAFLTYHKAKGLERKAVVVVGFDEGLARYAAGEPPAACPLTTYVAVTRASVQLAVVQGERESPYSFLPSPLEMFCSVSGRARVPAEKDPEKPRCYGVCDLLRNKSHETYKAAMGLIEVRSLRPPGDRLSLCSEACARDGLKEKVQEITGVAIPVAHAVRSGCDMREKYGERPSSRAPSGTRTRTGGESSAPGPQPSGSTGPGSTAPRWCESRGQPSRRWPAASSTKSTRSSGTTGLPPNRFPPRWPASPRWRGTAGK